MELIVESDDGRVLGSCDLEGTRWKQIGDHFENLWAITVTIKVGGMFGNIHIKNGNERVTGTHTCHGYLQPGFRLRVMAHNLRINPSAGPS